MKLNETFMNRKLLPLWGSLWESTFQPPKSNSSSNAWIPRFSFMIPLRTKLHCSSEETRRATVRPGDPIVWCPEGCVTKFYAHPQLNRTMQRTEVFWKGRSPSLSGNDSLERKETNSHFSSVPLILLDSRFISCLQLHTQRTVAPSLSCTPALSTPPVFPLFFLSSFCSINGNANFWFHRLTPVPLVSLLAVRSIRSDCDAECPANSLAWEWLLLGRCG